jgi:putative acetyltransferase
MGQTAPAPPVPFTLAVADTPALLQQARALFLEYAGQLGVDLCFQGFDAELAALVDGEPAGCGAFRPLPEADYVDACEMKRLYVRRPFRRFGLGRLLAEHLLDRAFEAGYSTMLLDTLDDMEAARQLYETLGFREIPPYYFNPVPGAHYLKVDLGARFAARA